MFTLAVALLSMMVFHIDLPAVVEHPALKTRYASSSYFAPNTCPVFLCVASTPSYRVKRAHSRTSYYSNSTATFNVILQSNDIETNPGPSPKCSICEKTVRINQKRLLCEHCREVTHAKCVNQANVIQNSRTPHLWTCQQCLHLELPKIDQFDFSFDADEQNFQNDVIKPCLETLNEFRAHTSIAHLNTRSVTSSFDEFNLMLTTYGFDIVALSETWLKDNNFLLDYVTIPGYNSEYRNREQKRGGGVGFYLKENIKYQVRKDLVKLDESMEHLWLEVKGKNKNASYLMGTFYQPSSIAKEKTVWLEKFDKLISQIMSKWDGIVIITGDFNINLFEKTIVAEKFRDILSSFDLSQHIDKPTRNDSLIDHVISNIPSKVIHQNVLPCDEISDHDAPYVIMNIRKEKFEKRYKYIRDEKQLNLNSFVTDFSRIPFSVIDVFDDPEDQLYMINSLITKCIDIHAPLKRVKLTRPPAPWMKDNAIISAQRVMHTLRENKSSSDEAMKNYRIARNNLKRTIKWVKKDFFHRALSSNRPKEVWSTIKKILNPNPKCIRLDPDEINRHFNFTAARVTGKNSTFDPSKYRFAPSQEGQFHLRHVTTAEIEKQILTLRNDCSTGFDNIPVKFIKPVSNIISLPLSKLINNCIDKNCFPTQWKIAKVCPVPKIPEASKPDEFRPISVLPILSKIFEKIIMSQLTDYIEQHNIYADTQSGFRKGHSTEMLLLKLRDDLYKAMQKGEVTLSVTADYSKAFDTVDYQTMIDKLTSLNFSNHSILLFSNYLANRKQYIEINDTKSEYLTVDFGVPQGSILGPILFNIYVSDLTSITKCNSIQYADDTNIYINTKRENIMSSTAKIQTDVTNIMKWSTEKNLVFNAKKTKSIIFSTKQLSRIHHLDDPTIFNIYCNNTLLERVQHCRILGITFDQHLDWSCHVKNVIHSCYVTISTLKKMSRTAPFKIRKNLAQALILSKLDYGNTVYRNLPDYQFKRLQRVQNVAASFVTGRYMKTLDVISKLGWLPIKERFDCSLAKLAHKVLYKIDKPEYIFLERNRKVTNFRQNVECHFLKLDSFKNTFQDSCCKLFDCLPSAVQTIENFSDFKREVEKYYFDKALARVLSNL